MTVPDTIWNDLKAANTVDRLEKRIVGLEAAIRAADELIQHYRQLATAGGDYFPWHKRNLAMAVEEYERRRKFVNLNSA